MLYALQLITERKIEEALREGRCSGNSFLLDGDSDYYRKVVERVKVRRGGTE